MKNLDMVYALLDFDGFVCKAFYASLKNKSDDAFEILNRLVETACEKASEYFEVNDVVPIMIASAHSWKKDVYPQYKSHRKRNDDLGKFRQGAIEAFNAVKIEQLEADEVVIMLHRYLFDRDIPSIIFSDDKDLKYYSKVYCKINLNEEPEDTDTLDNWHDAYAQMLAGDKEDNIKGIPNIGMVKARKLLDKKGLYTLKSVVELYKEHKIPKEDCLEQLALVIPVCQMFCFESKPTRQICITTLNEWSLPDIIVQDAIYETLNFIQGAVNEVYSEKITV